ncbi:hypothetical protein ACFL04_01010 [Patescibacteria group bacterium]
MRNSILIIQMIVLLAGTAFAWFTVYQDFDRFITEEGTIFKVDDCTYPNPVITPCFYGAFAFLVAFIWSAVIYNKSSDHQYSSQKKLIWLLVASVIFAWSVNIYELWKYYSAETDEVIGCSGLLVNNPYTTPCFIGASIFLIALVAGLSARNILKINKEKE